MNKIKLSLIAIATLVASNVNAQTYYSCIPEGCPAGQYFDGVKCLALPATHTHTACPSGQYFDGVKCLELCPNGYIVENMKCCKSNCNVSFRSIDSSIYLNGKLQYGQAVDCSGKYCYYDYNLNLQRGNCIKYQYTNNGLQRIMYQDEKDRKWGETKTICCNECL